MQQVHERTRDAIRSKHSGTSRLDLATSLESLGFFKFTPPEKIASAKKAFEKTGLAAIYGDNGRIMFHADAEALSQKLIDYVAPSEQELFREIASKPVKRFNGESITLNLVGKPERLMEETLKERILSFLMEPDIAFILLAIGALALYTEFNHPGAVIPGTVGVVFILLAVFALHLLPIRFAAVVLILASFVLFALEAKFVTHGVLAIGGITTLVIGALLLVDAPIPEMRVKLATALAVSIPVGLITVFLMTVALRARRSKVTTGAEGLVGEVAIAQTALAPVGKVFVHGELWDAVASANVPAGDKVVVEKVEGLQLRVQPAHDSERVTLA